MNRYKFQLEGKDFELITYSLHELSSKSKEKAIQDHLEFLNREGEDVEDDFGNMRTQYDFLNPFSTNDIACVIDNIEANDYEYDFHGEIVPITQFCGKHPKSGQKAIRINKQEIDLSIV